MKTNVLYYGDNLSILSNREYFPDSCVDLIYLDPPFNSKATYNILFKEPTGEQSQAQITAFDDTWHWGDESEQTFRDIVSSAPANVVEMMTAFRKFIHENDMMAYLTMMCPRLIELRRVLKDTGSIYLHCDPTASHYLKILIDAIFGHKRFRNEIAWGYRTGGTSKLYFARKHDIILFYAKGDRHFFKPQHYKSYQMKQYKYSEKYPEYYDDEKKSWYHLSRCRDIWDDIPAIGTDNKERLGYPTQKPEALLERIIDASSRKGEVILDPFCGCGTALVAAERLKRNWIGIDITHLAISTMKYRLHNIFPSAQYKVIGEPVDLTGARELAKQNKYQFQWWAVSLVGGQPYGNKKKGADTGIDGYVYFMDEKDKVKKAIVSVKGGNTSVKDIRDLNGVIDREKAEIGIFITLEEPTKPMKTEAVTKGFYKSPLGKDYPKVQILIIEELLNDKKPDIPPWVAPVQIPTRDKGEKSQKLELF